jgi:hypothetical protein
MAARLPLVEREFFADTRDEAGFIGAVRLGGF